MTGQASIPARDLDLEGKATLVSSATANEFELPFTVDGSWDDPIILPDASILIRRSGAAAPLLDAVKQHSAGEAVRKVIDQIFAAPPGRRPAPLAAAPATATTAPPQPQRPPRRDGSRPTIARKSGRRSDRAAGAMTDY